MPRKSNDTASEFFDLLCVLPWWMSVAFGIAVYVSSTYVLPGREYDNVILQYWAPHLPQVAWFGAFFLIPAAMSAARSARKRKILEKQQGIETIRALSWREFEELIGEAFRRQGYTVRENLRGGPDGGVDLELERNGNLYLVQAKHWQAAKVGVKVVREMLGLVTAHRAHGAIIIASGLFTQQAKAFATDKPIDLIEGDQLLQLVQSVQKQPAAQAAEPTVPSALQAVVASVTEQDRPCPHCSGNLVMRTARRGPNAGQSFWGCSNYPNCRYTEPVAG